MRGSDDRFDSIAADGSITPEAPEALPWLVEAARLHDHSAGPASGGRRLVWAAEWLHKRLPTDLPWCGLFVGRCIRAALPGHRLPWFSFRGRPWRRFGEPAQPQLGAILVFWLRWRRGPFGHVGFCWGEDDESYHVLGGNQHHRILVERFPKERLIDCRWPSGVPQPHIHRYHRPESAAPFEHAATGPDRAQTGGEA